MLRILGYPEREAYSEPCQKSTMEHFEKQLTAIIIFASYNYFRNISLTSPLVHEINIIFKLQKSLFNVKKYGDRGRGAGGREF